jgi:hypothetical protein
MKKIVLAVLLFCAAGSTFASEQKIVELAERGKADLSLESSAALQHGIDIGRGGVWLELRDEQYRCLK